MSEMDPLSAAIERLVGHFARVFERFDQIDNKFSDQVTRLDHAEMGLQTFLAEMTRSRGELMARLDRQQDLLTAIRDDISVNMAATVRVQKGGSEARQDMAQLTEQVSLIHRRLIQLEERVDRSGDRP